MTAKQKSSIFEHENGNSLFSYNLTKLMLSAEYCEGWKDAIDDLIKSFGPPDAIVPSREAILDRACRMSLLAREKNSTMKEHMEYLEFRLRDIEKNVLPEYEKLLAMKSELLDFQAKHKSKRTKEIK